MENYTQNIEFINHYLNKSLSANESETFLNKLKTDSYFNNLYEEHIVFLEGLNRQTLKAEIKSAKHYYTKMKWVKYIGISTAIVVTSILTYLFLISNNSVEPKPIIETNDSIIISDSIPTEKEVFITDTLSVTEKEDIKEVEVLEKQQPEKELISLESLKKSSQTFVLNSKKDTTIVCKEGTKLTVKANSFVDKNNNIVEGNIRIAVTEYYKVSDMLLANLSTTSDDKQLETGGMLYIEAKNGDSDLKVKENTGIEIHFPTQAKKENMQLFSGTWKDDVINWELQPNQDLMSEESVVKFLKVEEIEERIEEVPFAVIQQPPVYPGCENSNNTDSRKCTSNAISEFVQNNFNTNIADALGLKGRLRLTSLFKINEAGKIVSIQSRGPHPALEAEADRVIGLLPKMQPGKQRGQVVMVPYSLPIIFQVDGISGNTSVMGGLPMVEVPKADSIITTNFENSLVRESSARTMSANVNSYILRSLNLGWINCDRFIKSSTQRIKYSIKNNNGNKAVVSMIFKSINSVLPSHYINGGHNFGTIGKNEDVILVAIKKDGDTLYLDVVETNTQENPYIEFDFKEVTVEELKEELNKLNKLFQ